MISTRRTGRVCLRTVYGWALLVAFVAFLLVDAGRRVILKGVQRVRMAHEVDRKDATKRELEMENGKAVPAEDEDEDAED